MSHTPDCTCRVTQYPETRRRYRPERRRWEMAARAFYSDPGARAIDVHDVRFWRIDTVGITPAEREAFQGRWANRHTPVPAQGRGVPISTNDA